MNRRMNYLILALGTLIMAGCSAVPKQTEAPKPAEPPVTAADAASAIMSADLAISDAKQRKNLWRDTTKILDKADEAMSADEFREARNLANEARHQAEAAVVQSYRGDALFLIATLRKDYMGQMSLDQITKLDSAASALDVGQERAAYDTAAEIMAEIEAQIAAAKPEPVPAPQAEMASYTINRNDNLWSIAAKAEVYGNVDMWPLLWKANKEKIKHPDDITVGMKLVIDRSASKEAVAAAIKHSKLRGAKSLGPVNAFDQQYLSR